MTVTRKLYVGERESAMVVEITRMMSPFTTCVPSGRVTLGVSQFSAQFERVCILEIVSPPSMSRLRRAAESAGHVRSSSVEGVGLLLVRLSCVACGPLSPILAQMPSVRALKYPGRETVREVSCVWTL